jgi:2,3-bisphosphoglycerate-dependent phosphoglycerate mutase
MRGHRDSPIVWLARHAESVWNKAGIVQGQANAPGLTEAGVVQARGLATRMAGRGAEVVVTSDLLRAVETARVIADTLGVPLVTEPLLRERDLGCIEGGSQAQLVGELSGHDGTAVTDPDARPMGGESLRDLSARVERCLEGFRSWPPAQRFVAVTHGGFLRVALNLLQGRTVDAMTWPPAPNAVLWRVDLATGDLDEVGASG